MLVPSHGAPLSLRGLLTALLILLALTACSTTQRVTQQRLMAPEHVEVAQLRDLAIIEFTGNAGTELTRDVTGRLEDLRVEGAPFFSLAGPMRLHSSRDADFGSVEHAEALDFGRRMETRGVLLGRARMRSSVDLEPAKVWEECADYSKKQKRCKKRESKVRHCGRASVDFAYRVQALEVETGRVVYDPPLQELSDDRSECRTAKLKDSERNSEEVHDMMHAAEDRLRRKLMDQAAQRIHHDISPYYVSVQLEFLKKSDALQGLQAERFAVGAGLVGEGQIESACGIWRNLELQGASDLALSYNLAACAEHREDYARARTLYDDTQRHADLLLRSPAARDGSAAPAQPVQRNYSFKDWAELIAKARSRVAGLEYTEETMRMILETP